MAERGSPGANLRALTRSTIVPPCGDRDDHARLARICPNGKRTPPTRLPGHTQRCPASQLLGELARASLSPPASLLPASEPRPMTPTSTCSTERWPTCISATRKPTIWHRRRPPSGSTRSGWPRYRVLPHRARDGRRSAQSCSAGRTTHLSNTEPPSSPRVSGHERTPGQLPDPPPMRPLPEQSGPLRPLPTADPREDALDGFTGADARVSVDAAGITVKFS
jgi:hypothetical protein